MHRMPTKPRAVLLPLNLRRAADDLQFRTVIEVTGLGALEPDHLSIFLRHDSAPFKLFLLFN